MMTSSQTPLMVGKPTHRWWILAVLATAQLMVALDAAVMSIALPDVAGLAVGPLLRPGLAEVGASTEIATDGAPACVELKGESS